MADLVYEKLSRPKKLAVFLIVVGPEVAAEILRHFEDTDLEMVCREMGLLTVIPRRPGPLPWKSLLR